MADDEKVEVEKPFKHKEVKSADKPIVAADGHVVLSQEDIDARDSLTRPKPVDANLDLGDGESVRITFDANKVTPAWVADVERRLNDKDVLSVPKALAEAIISWDVTDEGQPWPATADNLAVFSFPAMSVFFEAIMEAAVPGVAEGNESSPSANEQPSATSPPMSPSSPNGSDTSTSPPPSVAHQLS